jgi:hypothetical protein
MKAFIAAAVIAAFSASPLLACDAMKGEYHKSDTKAELKPERKAKAKAKAKAAKSSKAVKPLVEGKTEDKKI